MRSGGSLRGGCEVLLQHRATVAAEAGYAVVCGDELRSAATRQSCACTSASMSDSKPITAIHSSLELIPRPQFSGVLESYRRAIKHGKSSTGNPRAFDRVQIEELSGEPARRGAGCPAGQRRRPLVRRMRDSKCFDPVTSKRLSRNSGSGYPGNASLCRADHGSSRRQAALAFVFEFPVCRTAEMKRWGADLLPVCRPMGLD